MRYFFFFLEDTYTTCKRYYNVGNVHKFNDLVLHRVPDLGDPCNRGVRGHDSQGEATVLVQADDRGLRRSKM